MAAGGDTGGTFWERAAFSVMKCVTYYGIQGVFYGAFFGTLAAAGYVASVPLGVALRVSAPGPERAVALVCALPLVAAGGVGVLVPGALAINWAGNVLKRWVKA